MNYSSLINEQLREVLSKLKNYLETLYQDELEQIILFGSQARGEAKLESDIDVLIILKNPFSYYNEVHEISQFISDLCLEENLFVSCCFTNKEQWKTENNVFFRNIKREGIAL